MPQRGSQAWRTTGWATALCALVALVPEPALAKASWSVRIGPAAGALVLDQRLSDYRWETELRPVWGMVAMVAGKRGAAGLRVWRSATRQSTGVAGVVPTVRLTGSEAVGEYRLAGSHGFRMLATGSVGTLHLGYSPDQVAIDPGSGDPTVVNFAPVDEPIAGLGLALRRSFFRTADLALAVERSWFRIDTSHRAGSEIEERRETFANWVVRLELSHRVVHF